MTPDMNEPGNNHLRPGYEEHLTVQEKAMLLHVIWPESGFRKLYFALNAEEPLHNPNPELANIAVFKEKVWEPLRANGVRSHPKPKTVWDGCPICRWVLGELHEARE